LIRLPFAVCRLPFAVYCLPFAVYHFFRKQDMSSHPMLGLIGAGTMGSGMAKNLIKAGFALTVFDLKIENVNALVQAGATAGSSTLDVIQKSDVTLTSLPTSGTFVKVAEEIIPHLTPNKIIIDTGTTEVPETKRLAQLIRQKGADLVDAPVSGGGRGAETGTLAIMVGGADEAVQRCMPILNVIGDNIGHLGNIGAGQLGKAINQIAMGVGLAAFAEALYLGVQAGIDPQKIWDTLSTAGAAKTSFQNAARQVIEGRIEAQDFKLRELPYFIAQAKNQNINLPLTEALYNFASRGKNRTTDPLGIPTPSFWYELNNRSREDSET
jgi:3-hydroxyisobutyrate dehydrogenase-like beta-hydroxyacid dehydrogenase